jgi:hypothetical protein
MRRIWSGALALALVAFGAALRAETVGASIKWENEKWIPVAVSSEGIEITEVRFEVEGGIHWNPLRAGIGPQAFVHLKNGSDHEMKLAVAIALFDGKGTLVGATEASNIGSLSPGESKEIKMTFREVKRKFFEAKTGQIALETYK